jgi:hypothetical protein
MQLAISILMLLYSPKAARARLLFEPQHQEMLRLSVWLLVIMLNYIEGSSE